MAPRYDNHRSNGQGWAMPGRDEAVLEGFGPLLANALDEEADLSRPATWERIAKLVATNWHLFNTKQSPLSTLMMVTRCGEMVLKCKVVAKKQAGGDDEGKELAALQQLFAELTAVEVEDEQREATTPDTEEDEDE
jgi:hypothetical protein